MNNFKSLFAIEDPIIENENGFEISAEELPAGYRLLWISTLLIVSLLVFTIISLSFPNKSYASTSRIKDVVNFEGIRENLLVGYGLVVGLNGTGDKLNNAVFTQKSLQSFLTRLGVSTINEKMQVKNVAAVTITAKLPPFARSGTRLDVTVSTLGDAKSLEGGTLVATPLMGADGEMYAVAQGSISIGGFSAKGDKSSITKGVPTTGLISNGAIVEKEIPFELDELTEIKLALKTADLTTAKAVEAKINEKLGENSARATDPGTVVVNIPEAYSGSVATLLSEIELLEVKTDQPARIVIDETTGTIVMNENVKIDNVAVSQGNLVVTINKTPVISQPSPFAPEGAKTVETTQETIKAEEQEGNIAILNNNATLSDLVNALNSLGVSNRDLISILQAIKTSGALHAEIVTR
jgi:flagellar P-ring protein precursor FlgI